MSASAPDSTVKGWCPGAFRPMRSGDGLIVRVKPQNNALSGAQMLGLCQIAQNYGTGLIDLTNRANLQLRAVRDAAHQDVLDALSALDLLDATPDLEARRNIITPPVRAVNGRSEQLAQALAEQLHSFPELPGKFGFSVDCEGPRQLSDAPSDIRFETSTAGELILRADGADSGQITHVSTAIEDARRLALWFSQTRSKDVRRMAKHLETMPLPVSFTGTSPAALAPPLTTCVQDQHRVCGVAFGSLDAKSFAAFLHTSDVQKIVVTHRRMLVLSGVFQDLPAGLISPPTDPMLNIDACPGAPFCSASSVLTRSLAPSLAPTLNGKTLHISGCAKGCARPRAADVVAVGRDGAFDLVRNGHPWDEPVLQGVAAADLAREIGRL